MLPVGNDCYGFGVSGGRPPGGSHVRKIAVFLLGAVILFFILKLDWRWLIPVVPVCIFLLRFVVPKEGNINKTFITWVAVFVGVALTFVWLIRGFLHGVAEGQYEAIQPGDLFAFFFGTDLLIAFWAVVFGVALAGMLFIDILVPYANQVAKNRYGDYEQYKGNERLAARTALGGVLGISQGTWMVKGGKSEVLDKPGGSLARLGGPGVLIVQQGHAVMLEQSGKISRIVHSGITWLRPFEYIGMVVPLQTRLEVVTVGHLATRDKVLIDEFEFLVFHRVDRGPELTQTRDGQYAYDKETLLTRIWSPSGGDWRESVKSISSRAARDVMGRYDLADVFPLTETMRQEFNRQLTAQINSITMRALGVEIVTVDTGKVVIPRQTEEMLVSHWMANWEQKVSATRAETEQLVQLSKTTARMQAIQGISRGLRQLLGPNANADDYIALRYIEYLEHSAESSSSAIDDQFGTLMKLQGLEALRSLQTSHDGVLSNNGRSAANLAQRSQ